MAERAGEPELTDSLEDYLETVYELVRAKKFARVKDIAKARQVRPGSVSPAMRRLAELGMIEYVRREYISLTAEGEARARRVVARHQLLCRLFEDILQMSPDKAEEEACAMEHSLSDEAMDRLVRFFEFIRVCPEAADLLHRFHNCPLVQENAPDCEDPCVSEAGQGRLEEHLVVSLTELQPGERGVVTHLNGQGSVRRRLLDIGLMPEVVVELDRFDTTRDEVRIGVQGFEIVLAKEEAEAVLVTRE